jgi:hypothetical protein
MYLNLLRHGDFRCMIENYVDSLFHWFQDSDQEVQQLDADYLSHGLHRRRRCFGRLVFVHVLGALLLMELQAVLLLLQYLKQLLPLSAWKELFSWIGRS